MNSKQVQVEAVAAADRFFSSRPWQVLDGEQVFALEIEGCQPIAACVLGSGGREYGLSLVIGDRAVEEMLAICEGKLQTSDLEGMTIWFSLTRRKDITAPFDRPLVAARREGRMAPLFMTKEAEKLARSPRRGEFEILLLALQALAVAEAQDIADFEHPLTTGLVSTLIVRGAGRSIEVERVERAAPAAAETSKLRLVTAEAPPALLQLPTTDKRYAIAAPELPMRIEGQDRAVYALVVVDLDTGDVAMIDILDEDPLPSARDRLLTFFANGYRNVAAGLPSTLLVRDHKLYTLIGPELSAAGVDCRHEPDLPEMADILDSFANHLLDMDDEDFVTVEGPDDLDGWKAVDHDVSDLLSRRGSRAALGNDKAWRRYLGCSRDALGPAFEELEDVIFTGYVDWYFHCYRATPRSRTIVERALAEELTTEQHAVITARAAGVLSFYRIEAIEVGAGATLLDVLSGVVYEVTDTNFSLTARVGLLVAARVYAVGAFHFLLPVGPVFEPRRAHSAFQLLETECRLQLGDHIPAESTHLLGRLWAWSVRADGGDSALKLEVKQMHVPTSVAATPEAALEAVYMQWLDTPIPDLAGQTPREACRTTAGRNKIARMIRAYPDPLGSSGARAPRKRMLAELGLTPTEASEA